MLFVRSKLGTDYVQQNKEKRYININRFGSGKKTKAIDKDDGTENYGFL